MTGRVKSRLKDVAEESALRVAIEEGGAEGLVVGDARGKTVVS